MGTLYAGKKTEFVFPAGSSRRRESFQARESTGFLDESRLHGMSFRHSRWEMRKSRGTKRAGRAGIEEYIPVRIFLTIGWHSLVE